MDDQLLVNRTDQILKTVMEKFDFSNPPVDPIELAKMLAGAVIEKHGLGISANQLGLPYRAFAIKAEQIIVCFNPIIVDASEKTIALEESCLTYPKVFLNIKRPLRIKVRYTEPNGNIVTKVFEGITARIFQHQIDIVNGKNFLDKVNRYHREKALKNAKLNPYRPMRRTTDFLNNTKEPSTATPDEEETNAIKRKALRSLGTLGLTLTL